jgi:hypothetical protein
VEILDDFISTTGRQAEGSRTDAGATQGHDHPARRVLASASRPLPAPGVRPTRVGRLS